MGVSQRAEEVLVAARVHHDGNLWRTDRSDPRLGRSPLHLHPFLEGKFDLKFRSEGMEWPAEAETMIGLKRLDNLHACIETVIRDQIPGDLIETGVWRGGQLPAYDNILRRLGGERLADQSRFMSTRPR